MVFRVGIAWEGGVNSGDNYSTLTRILRTHADYVNYITKEIEVDFDIISFTGSYNPLNLITSLRPHATQIKQDFGVDAILFVLKLSDPANRHFLSEEGFAISIWVSFDLDLGLMLSKMYPILHELNHIYLYQISPELSIDLDQYRGPRLYKGLWFETLPERIEI